MDKKHFVKTCVLCGYASKKRAIEYAPLKARLGKQCGYQNCEQTSYRQDGKLKIQNWKEWSK